MEWGAEVEIKTEKRKRLLEREWDRLRGKKENRIQLLYCEYEEVGIKYRLNVVKLQGAKESSK